MLFYSKAMKLYFKLVNIQRNKEEKNEVQIYDYDNTFR